MQTILGANGVIGQEVSKQLFHMGIPVRQVSRNPKKVNESDELLSADLLRFSDVDKAVAGSAVTYLLAGLPYQTKTWQEQWPKVMRHTIDACQKHNSKLVFFDNVYAYGLVSGAMTESTPFNPCSKKGEVRAQMATMLLNEIKRGNVQGMIVRSADFYGPGALLSMTHSTVHERLKSGKGAQWLGSSRKIHTFTFTPDAGKTTALLGNMPTAYNQTWHALTSKEQITGNDYVRLAAQTLGNSNNKVSNLPTWGVRLLGVFVPVLRELTEMMYQFENDYIFDSAKVEQALALQPTSYQPGIKQTLNPERK
jgi:nucleoside-diphosphate-sugar epimerase